MSKFNSEISAEINSLGAAVEKCTDEQPFSFSNIFANEGFNNGRYIRARDKADAATTGLSVAIAAAVGGLAMFEVGAVAALGAGAAALAVPLGLDLAIRGKESVVGKLYNKGYLEFDYMCYKKKLN